MTSIEIENRTPHPISLLIDHVKVLLPTVLPTPRVQLTAEVVGYLRWDQGVIPVRRTRLCAGVTDLPARRENRLLVVSRLVAEAVPDRDDLVFPDDVLRDAAGAVIGCHALTAVSSARWTGQTVKLVARSMPAAGGD